MARCALSQRAPSNDQAQPLGFTQESPTCFRQGASRRRVGACETRRSTSIGALHPIGSSGNPRSCSTGTICQAEGQRPSAGPRGAAPRPRQLAKLLAQVQGSRQGLAMELTALQGLASEVSQRLQSLGKADSLQGRPPEGGGCLTNRSTGTGTSGCLTESTTASTPFSADPAAVEAAMGHRAAAPVGARHRHTQPVGEREATEKALLELEKAAQRCHWALNYTESLASKLEGLTLGDTPRGPPRAACAAAAGAAQTTRLSRQLQECLEVNRSLCCESCAMMAQAMRYTNQAAAECWRGGTL